MKTLDRSETDSHTPNHFFEKVFEYIPVATAILSGSTQITAVNRAFKDLFDLSDEATETPVSLENISNSFWLKQDFQQHLHHTADSGEERTQKIFDWQHEDGSLKYIELRTRLFTAPQPLLILSFCDVSDRKQVEKEHSENIRHMMHELRNPLSNISLCVELLADSTKENNQEETDMFLSKASNSVQRMKQIINDLNASRKTA